MRPFVLASIALLSLPLAACETSTSVDCTAEARASVQLTVVDAQGAAVSEATAIYSGGGFADEPCTGTSDVLVCGWEVSGPVGITVRAPGFADETLTVTVPRTEDDCHVVTQQQTVTLVAAGG